jgi:hypothetical protein
VQITTGPQKIFVYQIFYDEKSRAGLDPGFIPLDNTANERPDWFEFWVIRNYLKTQTLQPNSWYGFLSPKFEIKTRLTSQVVMDALKRFGDNSDVALFSPGWDQLAYFLNPFEQGDLYHPGMMEMSQDFFDRIGMKTDLRSLVTHSSTSVFCNYMVAKPKFWSRWLSIADRFFDFVEGEAPDIFRQSTNYGVTKAQYGDARWPMKTFIQERIASMLLAREDFAVLSLDQSVSMPIFAALFNDDPQTRRMLQICDFLKKEFCLTKDEDYLKMYWKVRRKITFHATSNLAL